MLGTAYSRVGSWCVLAMVSPLFLVSARADDGPYHRIANIFEPVSKPAEEVSTIAWLTIAICIGIFVVVAGLLTYAVIAFRARRGDDREPPQVYGSTQIELAWTVIPILITFVLILVTARTIGSIQNHRLPENALHVTVVGHQWWWEIRYHPADDTETIIAVTANELHIPLSVKDGTKEERRPTRVFLESADVVHSYWVPQLAGKVDVIPNRRNELWFEPYAEGTYFGNCAEYCGTQHANMLIRVIVEPEEKFEKWLANQMAPPVNDPAVAKGRDMFFNTSCVNCHRIGGTIAQGVFGPDLTHLMTRQTIGSGVADLTRENLHAWVKDPQDIKVGCLMPDMQLTPEQVDAITDYLMTLK